MSTSVAISSEGHEDVERPRRDWFGYVFTTAIGLLISAGIASYQSYSADKEVAAAEQERSKAVIQSAVAIVEEHVLHGRPVDGDRLVRLIEKRRRDERISIPISVSDVVEKAEFNIASSHHLSIERKDQIKPIFDAFYAEQRSRAFKAFPASVSNAAIVNDIAISIQRGQSAEALTGLKRLVEAHSRELAEAKREARPTIFDGVRRMLSSPLNAGIFIVATILYFFAAYRFLNSWSYRRWRRRHRYWE
ncbi:MAG TPA: hypothetical protein VEY50_12535 [Lysobacter sp.]|nr:hypothetical protein [Lysobacter sp.]